MPSGYFDCFAGVAGDMILGALCDAGLPFAHLTRELKKLPIRGYGLARETARRGALGGTKIDVRAHFHDGAHGERSYRSIHRLIGQSRLARPIRALAQEIFYRLARAEARAHRIPVDRVHFH
ncbi:MAG: DUF111 family protein [Deltaproteobacteria bacterium]|nr:DUF111 family protein [Deltaproteobacteria bacterium]